MADISTQAFKFDGKSATVLRAENARFLFSSFGSDMHPVLPSANNVASGVTYGYNSNTTGTLVSSGGSSENWS